ncbi:uncharacterized protein LOC129785845 [Lutzomyia longipalpis]|uniref:uncharacterized protein LOC129785845 n=1 Tax=Lutzomyia longipalpis TaxID=7200 RepID=UPI0024838FD6|nr:uncharacterized protein LOC129785845 [Lutzomyia longipalpis]
MIYKSKTCRFIDLVKINQKFLAVSFEFIARNDTQKWVNERDWRDIEASLGGYIEEKKYLINDHTESINVAGDIQLEVTNTRCPSYVLKIFDDTCKSSLHGIQLSVNVKFGGLQKKYLEAVNIIEENKKASAKIKADEEDYQNGSNEEDSAYMAFISNDCTAPSSVTNELLENKFDEEKYVPQSTTPRLTRATYTPSKKIKTSGFEEYVPSGIPADTVNQYKATKRKRKEKITPDTGFKGLDSPTENLSISKASTSKRKTSFPPEAQVPHATSTKSSNKKKTNELFGPEDSDTDENSENTAEADIDDNDFNGNEPPNPRKDLQMENKDLNEDFKIVSPSPNKKRREKTMPSKESLDVRESAKKGPTMSPRKNCHHISMEDLLESFALVEEKMDKTIEKFEKYPKMRIPEIKDFHSDIVTFQQRLEAEFFLLDKYVNEEHRPMKQRFRLEHLLTQYVLPEWMINLFMNEHNMDRAEAENYLTDKEIEEKYVELKKRRMKNSS